MNIEINVKADLNFPGSAAGMMMIEARPIADKQLVGSSELLFEPFCQTDGFIDIYGNPIKRLTFPQGDVHVDYHATVSLPEQRLPMLRAVELSALELPADTLLYTLPSRYCQSDMLVNMAHDQFGDSQPGWARVQSICDWINRHITYRYGTSDSATSAYDTAAQRHGVCRDFAHLGISFCRASDIPARYVAGYCLGLDPPDFHAWFEAFLDGHWVAFDATQRQPRPALVTMAIGRDAADCAWSTFFGYGITNRLEVNVSEAAS